MSQVISISASYRMNRRIAKRSGSNFYRSFWLLPKPKRAAMYALYAFARTTDDLGDSAESVEVRTAQLEWWREVTRLNLADSKHPTEVDFPRLNHDHSGSGDLIFQDSYLRERARVIFPSLRDATKRYRIPSQYLLEIIDGVRADQQKTRFDTYEQVEHYCYLVASAVGLACLHIWEFDGELPLQAAIDCGIAFQLTNILRDVVEDAGRGRIYLPRQHYEFHGLCEEDLLKPRRDDRLRCLILDEVTRAEKLYVSGWQVWESLHPDGRAMFSMMWRTYRRLLDEIAKDPNQVISRRISVPRFEQTSLVLQHFVPFLYRRLAVPPSEVFLATGIRD